MSMIDRNHETKYDLVSVEQFQAIQAAPLTGVTVVLQGVTCLRLI